MASAEGDLTREDADKMRVVDLKEALKERQLPTDGKKAVLLERLAHALESPLETDEKGGGGADTVAPPLPEVDGEETLTDTEDEGGQDQGGVVVLPAATPMDVADTVETPAPQTEAGTGGVNGAPTCNDVGSGDNMVHENGVEEAKEACAVKEGMDESRPLACGDQKDDAGSGAVEEEEVTAAPKDGMDERRAPACDGREEEGADDDDSGDLALFVASLGGEAGGAGEAESGGNAPGVAVEHGEPGKQNAVEDMAVEPSVETVDAAESALAVAAPAAAPAAAAVDAAPAVASPSFSFTPEVLQTAAAPSNSEDTYAYEEEQERLTMLKNLHQPMRKWFNKDATMRQKYGNYPLFWQDLASWPHMKELKKLYLIAVERLENPEAAAANDAAAAAEGAAATAAANAADAAAVNTPAADTAAAADGTKPAEAGASVAGAAEGDRVSSGETETASAGGDGSPTAPEGAVTEGDDGKKKRKNRWGDARRNRFASKGDDAADAAASSNKRKSRWSSDGLSEAVPAAAGSKIIPGMPVNLSQEQIQETLVLQMRLQQANEKLATVDQDAITRSQDPERSPSPPPRYDANGVRTNNRNVRMRDGLNRERTKVIEEMMKLNPMFRPPADFVKSKPHRKLYIPSDEYPGYNFIGLIIGPRGNTQKRLERETGCKIAIRGKGSVKEGARRGPTVIDEDDELHVYISGESEDAVTKAATEVGKLLRPLDDEQNEHKQKQLKELALINGTLREEDYCSICGEKGHRQFECPKRAQSRPVTVEVRCALCGDTSHPTRDCLLHKTKQNAGQPGHEASLDKEYMSFMAELGDGDGVDGAVPQTGPRPPAASSAGGGAGGGIASVSVSGSAGKPGPSPSAPLTNHYVWTPPVATPARPPVVSKPPPMPSHQSPLPAAPAPASSATLGYSHSSSNSRPNSMPMGGHRVSPFSRASRGVGAVNGAAPVPPFRPPPPMAPPGPPIAPAVSNGGAAVGGGGGGMLPPPPLPPVLPPPQPPKAVGAPAPGTGAYSYAPPPLPPQAVYGQQQQQQSQQQQQQQIGSYGGSAGGYSAYPGPPPVAPPVPPPPVSPWGATTQPPLPPASSGSVGGYVPPPLPPSMPGAPPTWPPTLPSPQEYAPPPLPPSDASGGNGQFLGGSPPLPPPPLPGQPPLPPG